MNSNSRRSQKSFNINPTLTKAATAALFVSALMSFAEVSAHEGHGHLSLPAAAQNQALRKGRAAPELFDSFGVTQQANKVLPEKAIKGRNRSVNVNIDLLWSDALTLTLFDDVVVTVVRDRLIDNVKGVTTWVGHVEGESNSEVFLTVTGRTMSGTVRIGDDLYEINLGANELHEIIKVDPSKNPEHHNDGIAVDDIIVEMGDLDETASSEPAVVGNTTAGTMIDIMVVYTPKARTNAGGKSGIESRILNAIASANQSYLNSKVDMHLNLVHMAEINYSETGDMLNSLTDVTGTSDGKMDEVHKWRNDYGADQVALITAESNYCGIAYVMTNPTSSFAPYAFSVIHDDSRYACLSNHTFAHELGHNQGSTHDLANGNPGGAYDYSYGYRLCQTGGFLTVMSYACSGATRVGHFSNPNVTYNGEYTGTPTEDNARSMNNTKDIVAAFRKSIDTSTPAAPSNLAASALSDTEITISWADNSDNETGFRLERSIDAKSWYEFAVVGSNVKSFTDTGLAAATSYYYRVRAYNSNGNSSYSNTVSSTTQNAVVESCVYSDPALTLAPSTLYALPGASVAYSISLTNKDSSACGASTFTLTNSDGGVLGSYSLSPGASTSATWNTTSPTVDGSHSKSVTASASAHNTASSSATILVDGTAPTAPANLKAAVKRNSQVDLSWGASSDSGSGVSHYVVSRNGTAIGQTTNLKYSDRPGKGSFTYTVEAIDKATNKKGSSVSTGGSSKDEPAKPGNRK